VGCLKKMARGEIPPSPALKHGLETAAAAASHAGGALAEGFDVRNRHHHAALEDEAPDEKQGYDKRGDLLTGLQCYPSLWDVV
jgi:hypothetical protein